MRCVNITLSLTLSLLGLVFTVAAEANVDLVVNEILGDPAIDWDGDGEVSASNDEWVEIYNAGTMAANLDEYRLGDVDQGWMFGFTGSLAPGGRVVVYGSDSKVWQAANGVGAFGLRLSNTGDTVVLWHLTPPDATAVDSYTYASHEADDDRSTGRRPDGAPTIEVFDFFNPYNGTTLPLGNGCAPTPDLSNNCVTPVEPSTWGSIKASQR